MLNHRTSIFNKSRNHGNTCNNAALQSLKILSEAKVLEKHTDMR